MVVLMKTDFQLLLALCLSVWGWASIQLEAQQKTVLPLLDAKGPSTGKPINTEILARLYDHSDPLASEPLILHFKAGIAETEAFSSTAELRIPVRFNIQSKKENALGFESSIGLTLKTLNQEDLGKLGEAPFSATALANIGESWPAELDLTTGEIVVPIPAERLSRYRMLTNATYEMTIVSETLSTKISFGEIIVPNLVDRPPTLDISGQDNTGFCHPKMTAFAVPWISHLNDEFRIRGQYFTPEERVDILLRYVEDGQNEPLADAVTFQLGPFLTNEHGWFDIGFSFKNPEYPSVFRIVDGEIAPEGIMHSGIIHAGPDSPFRGGTYHLQIRDLVTLCEIETDITALGTPNIELSRDSGQWQDKINDDPLTLTGRFFRPSSNVDVFFIHPERGRILVEQVQTNGLGEFRIHDLFFRGGGAFSLTGATLIRAVGESGHRAETQFVLVSPRIYVSVDGEVGHLPTGNALSDIRITGYSFPPNIDYQFAIEQSPEDLRPI